VHKPKPGQMRKERSKFGMRVSRSLEDMHDQQESSSKAVERIQDNPLDSPCSLPGKRFSSILTRASAPSVTMLLGIAFQQPPSLNPSPIHVLGGTPPYAGNTSWLNRPSRPRVPSAALAVIRQHLAVGQTFKFAMRVFAAGSRFYMAGQRRPAV